MRSVGWLLGGMGFLRWLLRLCVRVSTLSFSLYLSLCDGERRVLIEVGMVKSDLGRSYKTSYAMGVAVDTFMTLVSKSTEGGARTLVLSAMAEKEDNGKYYTNYQSEKDYEA